MARMCDRCRREVRIVDADQLCWRCAKLVQLENSVSAPQPRCPAPGPHMGAAYNALHEGGTKEDCLIAYARARGQCIAQAEEIRTLRAQLDKLRSDIGWEKDISRWGG